jgi:hypothetical protein
LTTAYSDLGDRTEVFMSRVLAVLGAIALLAVSVAPVLAGGKPVKASDGSPPPVTYPAGEVCDFDLLYEDILNTSHSLSFPAADDGTERVLFGGRIVVRLTNMDTDTSRVYNASGPGTFIFGDTLIVDANGPWLLTFFEGDADGPGAWYTRGHMRVEVDRDTGQIISATRPPNAIDVCEQLGGHAA